jgi:hypothetical protein
MSKEAMKLALEALQGSIAITMAKIDFRNKAIKTLEEALAKQDQSTKCVGEPVGEMVAWPNDFERVGVDWISYVPDVGTKLYTTPQQRTSRSDMTWVGLTDEEFEAIWKRYGCYELMREIEAKLKEKNT